MPVGFILLRLRNKWLKKILREALTIWIQNSQIGNENGTTLGQTETEKEHGPVPELNKKHDKNL
ncbi:MAG: hypothetical protein IJU86_03410 [Firmicutes bacterium]|nr:hypothetical protein [Bacillota bacterium]